MKHDLLPYRYFLSTPAEKQWRRIGVRRRAGVIAPLFSLHSSRSAGIGELSDLKLLADWCRRTGLSIIQLLPLQDMGFEFRPYDADSSFALDPVYLSMGELIGVSRKAATAGLKDLKRRFQTGRSEVDYAIKGAKLELLWKLFSRCASPDDPRFQTFCEEQGYWLNDYALYKVFRDRFAERRWDYWPLAVRSRQAATLKRLASANAGAVRFQKWLQWQLYEQMREVKSYVNRQGVYLLGDLPFLVSRHSADVWGLKQYFKLDLSAGAPPDNFLGKGQRWGMPPYHWRRVASDGYEYHLRKLRYAQNFYDLFRIDHAVAIPDFSLTESRRASFKNRTTNFWTICAINHPTNKIMITLISIGTKLANLLIIMSTGPKMAC
ncbi:MAG: 4-alpha-glucanotransferase [Candidatus Omnitrophica bacterium]|nr:4-alpha-glucanotransferase [Candidatus Omnitrophota bacterium]